MAPKGRGTIRKCGFVGVGVALLEKCVTVEVGIGVLYMFKMLPSVSVHVLLPSGVKI